MIRWASLSQVSSMKIQNKILLSAGLIFPGILIAQRSPNIVLINIDDLGWTDISSNGCTYYETPHIDDLRKKGIWINEAYSGSSNSAPSRACMLTGMYTPRHGIYTVGTPDRGDTSKRKLITIPNRRVLEPDIQILPQVLKEAGYQTCHIGKWHVTDNPAENGVELNIGGNNAGGTKSHFSPYSNKDLKDGPNGEYLMDRLGNEAVGYIRAVDKNRPFFLYLATFAVHTPLQADSSLVEKYKRKQTVAGHDNPVYAAMIENMDYNVGKVLAEIKKQGLEDNTLIVFTSDNGGLYRVSCQWPLRAGKGSFYEGGIRIPMIVYQKGRFEAKEIVHIPVSQIDLFPTFLDIAGIKRSDLILDGESLLPLLSEKNTEKYQNRPIYWHFPAYLEGNAKDTEQTGPYFRTRPVSVVRQGDWKLIENYETGDLELYNINEDISEKEDLAQKNKEKREELRRLLSNWKQQVQAPVPTELNPQYKNYKP
ncbi:hypothetical protein HMPREF1212_04230 [Parabacteroides sp. HGS0025]|nr:hypothetical protein HMPREF1212_04230 [Parabacteroides sp. HGS0025]